MTRHPRCALLVLLWLLGPGAYGKGNDQAADNHASQETAAFLAAARGAVVGPDAAQAYFLVDIFRRAEAPADEVDALRRELLHAYLAQLTAPPAPAAPPPSAWDALLRRLPGRAAAAPDTVAAAIARGRVRPAVLAPPFRDAWQAAFNQGLRVRWGPGEGRSPVFLMAMRDLQPLAPGAWAAPSADGGVWLRLSLRLANTSPRPLPIYKPGLLLGTAPDGTSPGLAFTCDWDRPAPPRPPSEMQANAVTLLAPGAESEPLACEAGPLPAFWRERLPAWLAADAAARPRLVSHDLDSGQRLFHAELALMQAAPQAIGWSQRLLVARQEAGSQWVADERALQPPERRRWASAPHQGWRSSLEALKWFLGTTVVGLGLFAAGRGLLRAGMPASGVGVGTLAAGAGLFALLLMQMRGGTGYEHPLYVGIGLWSVLFGPMLLAVLGLHLLHRQLDAEHRDWWDAVAAGWRHALDVTSKTSRGEFWGFLAHSAWLWALARACLMPLDRWIAPVLLVPVLTLTVRRLRSMSRQELVEIALTVVGVVLLVLI